MQEVFSVSNEVAAELATIGDGVLGALRDRLRCTILLDRSGSIRIFLDTESLMG